jgi:HK97 family phage major capsid protein
MWKNRAALLAWAKKKGYKGATNSLQALRDWFEEQNLDPEDIRVDTKEFTGNLKLADIWAKVAAITDEDDPDGDGDDEARAKIADLEAKIKAMKEKARLDKPPSKPVNDDGEADPTIITPKMHRIRAERKTYNKRAAEGRTEFADADIAEVFGACARTAITKAMNPAMADDREIIGKTQVEYSQVLGGNLVPTEYLNDFISIKEKYGMARQLLRTVRMARDTAKIPRDGDEFTIYAPGEATAGTASDAGVGLVNLTAVKMMGLCSVSSELFNDSVLNIGDWIGRKMAYAIAKREDQCAIVGDGTSTYFGILGITNALKGLSGTIANIAGLQVASGNAYSEITLADFNGLDGLLSEFETMNQIQFLCHPRFYRGWMRRIAFGGGGATMGGGIRPEDVTQFRDQSFLGYPVLFSNAMPRTEANSQVCALLGDFRMCGTIGDVTAGVQLESTPHFSFSSDTTTFRAVQRVAITIHDVGNASATEASRQPGPVVGLITAAS